jgi:hypothetical protein
MTRVVLALAAAFPRRWRSRLFSALAVGLGLVARPLKNAGTVRLFSGWRPSPALRWYNWPPARSLAPVIGCSGAMFVLVRQTTCGTCALNQIPVADCDRGGAGCFVPRPTLTESP